MKKTNIYRVYVESPASSSQWRGIFIGIPTTSDIIEAIERDILDLNLPTQTQQLHDYQRFQELVYLSDYPKIAEVDVMVAGVRVGIIGITKGKLFLNSA